MANQMCTVREMKDKGLHCAPDCFFSFPQGATPHLFAMPVGWAPVMDCEQKNMCLLKASRRDTTKRWQDAHAHSLIKRAH